VEARFVVLSAAGHDRCSQIFATVFTIRSLSAPGPLRGAGMCGESVALLVKNCAFSFRFI
jgi:hypothetical protein